jgi:hypothetical protein
MMKPVSRAERLLELREQRENTRTSVEALNEAIQLLENEEVAEALLASDRVSEADLELPVVGYGAKYAIGRDDGFYYAANTIQAVQTWLGQTPAVIEPLVRKADADQRIKELSDMVMSLSETQDKGYDKKDTLGSLVRIHDLVSSIPPTELTSKEALLETIDGSSPVTDRITSLYASDGIVGMPMSHGLTLYPTELHPDTVELAMGFALCMMIKLRKAETKYGHSNAWSEPDWMDECKLELRKHLEKGDPKDVAAYAMFLWYHGETTKLV